MAIEINGLIHHNLATEFDPVPLSHYDVDAIKMLAKLHDEGGYDKVLIANAAVMPDNFTTAAYVGAVTERLGVMLAHRPGFIAPTMAARMMATLDHCLGGRLAVHIITGASDVEMQGDGDYLDKVKRYARSAEYIDVLRGMWTSEKPFDHDGEWYRFAGGFAAVKPVQPTIPIYFGGMSPAALQVGANKVDVFATLSDTVGGMSETIQKVEAASETGDRPDFLISLRLVIGETEEAAWKKAAEIEAKVIAIEGPAKDTPDAAKSDGFRKTAELAAQGDRLEKCFWNGINKIRGSFSNSGALAGDPDQIVDALMDYYDIGVHRFILRGFDPLNDISEIGKSIIPAFRAQVAKREQG